MTSRRARWAAACLLAAALPASDAAAQAPPGALERAEGELRELTARLDDAERAASRPEESPRERAARFHEQAQRRIAAEDDAGALALLSLALQVPEFRASPALWEATWAQAEVLRRLELWSSALSRYRELLAAPGAPRAAEAAVRALDCAVHLGRWAEADEHYQAALRLSGREPPAEARYLAAKAAWRRPEGTREQRARRALELLARVGRPWHVHAAYFRGALRVALAEHGAALLELDGCALSDPGEGGARGAGRVRDLCAVGAARIIAAQGRHREAADAYSRIPVWSATFPDATYEGAYAWLRAGRPDLALRHVAILAELMADSPLGPQASLLRGNLLAQAGRWNEAVESYNRVINQYAPIRDEVEAILALSDDPARVFDELVGHPDAEGGSGLPQAASRWAARRPEMAPAMSLVATLEATQRELAEARLVGDRLDALLTRNYGLAASPVLEEAYQRADEVHTDAVWMEGLLAGEELRRLPQSPARLRLEAMQKEMQPLEEAARLLPSASREMDARRKDALVRLQSLQRRLGEIARLAEGVEISAAGLRTYLEQNRGELKGGQERPLIAEELRRHREIAAGYRAEVAQMAQAVNRELDVAGRGLRPDEERTRHEYRREVGRLVEALQPTRRALSQAERDGLARFDAARARLADLVGRADRLKRATLARARADVEKVRARAAAERKELEEAGRELERSRAAARRVVGKVAARAFREVQRTFYDLVLQADVGIIDVAWTRKRDRLDNIQALSSRKSDDLRAIEAAGAGPGDGP